MPNADDEPSKENQSEGGKTELSLMHFHVSWETSKLMFVAVVF